MKCAYYNVQLVVIHSLWAFHCGQHCGYNIIWKQITISDVFYEFTTCFYDLHNIRITRVLTILYVGRVKLRVVNKFGFSIYTYSFFQQKSARIIGTRVSHNYVGVSYYYYVLFYVYIRPFLIALHIAIIIYYHNTVGLG